MRLTHKKEHWCWKDEEFWLSAENPSLEKADEIYYKLAEFEDFMEEQGFEDLEHLDLTLKNLSYGAKYYAFWEKLKEYLTQKTEDDYVGCYIYPDNLKAMEDILEKMQELELADLIRRKEK